MKDNIHGALLRVQERVGTVKKNAQNPHFRSKYADLTQTLETVLPELHKEGIYLSQRPYLEVKEGTMIVSVTTCLHHVPSDTEVHTTPGCSTVGDPQKVGSAITYLRRYGLQSLLGLGVEDDDANGASATVTQQRDERRSQPSVGW